MISYQLAKALETITESLTLHLKNSECLDLTKITERIYTFLYSTGHVAYPNNYHVSTSVVDTPELFILTRKNKKETFYPLLCKVTKDGINTSRPDCDKFNTMVYDNVTSIHILVDATKFKDSVFIGLTIYKPSDKVKQIEANRTKYTMTEKLTSTDVLRYTILDDIYQELLKSENTKLVATAPEIMTALGNHDKFMHLLSILEVASEVNPVYYLDVLELHARRKKYSNLTLIINLYTMEIEYLRNAESKRDIEVTVPYLVIYSNSYSLTTLELGYYIPDVEKLLEVKTWKANLNLG